MVIFISTLTGNGFEARRRGGVPCAVGGYGRAGGLVTRGF